MKLCFSPKQRRALLWWREGGDYDGVICDGAWRSCKTRSMALGFFGWAMGR